MSLDGVVVHSLCYEISNQALGARVERIMQPSKDMVIFQMRGQKGKSKLLFNTSADSARIQFTENSPDNPQTPPMFCMLLRKHLQTARLTAINQLELDRVVEFVFDAYTELGDLSTLTLVIEIMGRYSNLILLNEHRKIIDAQRKIDFDSSSTRQILPGFVYSYPPLQDKHNIISADISIIAEEIVKSSNFLSKTVLERLQGFSPLPARELAFLVTAEGDKPADELTSAEKTRLAAELCRLKSEIGDHKTTPVMILEKNGRPKDITFTGIKQYEGVYDTIEFPSFSEMLDFFYLRKDGLERMRQRSGNLLKLLENTNKRIGRRIAAQMEELEQGKNRGEMRIKGDILTANIHSLPKAGNSVNLQNFFDPDYKEITIELDPRKTPAQNAQRYYSLYRKADTAEKKLTILIAEGRLEQEYVETVLDNLKRAQTEMDIEEIRVELVKSRYLKDNNSKKRKTETQKSKPLEFLSSDGFIILVGRNNMENDRLTLKDSSGKDIWLHTQKIPGSHTVIVTEGKEVPDRTLNEAAIIAAYHSKAQDSSKTPVDYTFVKNVKKPSGSKPGMVVYDSFKTIIADSNEITINNLRRKKS